MASPAITWPLWSFGLAYMSVILIEPLVDLGVCRCQGAGAFRQGSLFNVRLHQAAV